MGLFRSSDQERKFLWVKSPVVRSRMAHTLNWKLRELAKVNKSNVVGASQAGLVYGARARDLRANAATINSPYSR